MENIAYLASPEKKRLAFELLRRSVGTKPRQILGASKALLRRVAENGILPETTIEKLRQCARIAVKNFSDDLSTLKTMRSELAVKELRQFPSIGRPGAERILLFSNAIATLAPESNGIRVLSRLGLLDQDRSYSQKYQEANRIDSGSIKQHRQFQEANLLLQLHGRTLCTSKNPKCGECPLQNSCSYALNKTRRT